MDYKGKKLGAKLKTGKAGVGGPARNRFRPGDEKYLRLDSKDPAVPEAGMHQNHREGVRLGC